jgi:hypothetical protein
VLTVLLSAPWLPVLPVSSVLLPSCKGLQRLENITYRGTGEVHFANGSDWSGTEKYSSHGMEEARILSRAE